MKILITGGAGFIGSHIADEYVRLGHKVVVVDNLSTGKLKNVNPRAKFYKADIQNARAIGNIIKREKPNVINHHAAEISVIKSLEKPGATVATNVSGTLVLLSTFVRFSPRATKFIFASTGGALYGNPKHIPADEHTPILPLSTYGLSKYVAEELIHFYGRTYHLPYTVLRYSNVYGPRQNPKGEAGVVAIFGSLMKRKKRPTIFGDGTKMRDYVHVEDVVRANALALHKGKNETANIGCGKLTSDQAVFDTIAKYTGYRGSPIYAPYREGEIYKIALDASRAKKVLGWISRISFDEGIRKTVLTI